MYIYIHMLSAYVDVFRDIFNTLTHIKLIGAC